MSTYPASPADRDRFVLDRRPSRHRAHDPWKAHGVVVEDERTASGTAARTATVFITGRECPWRCVMCDLWQFTTEQDTPTGAIAAQVEAARADLDQRPDRVTQIKLYNAGSFFDPRAVPDADYAPVAKHLASFARVIVESHPSLVGDRAQRFVQALAVHAPPPALEVAMGLETAHPDALERLHKRMTLASFARAAERLRELEVGLRVFLLVCPPFVPTADQDMWLSRSVEAAFAHGASVVSLIPTRSGNGAIEALAGSEAFAGPRLADLERGLSLALPARPGPDRRVFADLWDLERFADCRDCLDSRRARLHAMNLAQAVLPPVECPRCGGSETR